jgi:type 1 glutamine amidotransferase
MNINCLRLGFLLILSFVFFSSLRAQYPAQYATGPRFKALVYYTKNAEGDHVKFAEQGVAYFKKMTVGDSFILDVTTDLSDYPYDKLKEYDIVVMFNMSPATKEHREAFQQYMENGGGWLGFHAAAYNDKNTQWHWFVDFLGGGVFYCNSWPAQPAKVTLDNTNHPITKNLPTSFIAPENEWYQWNPSPRLNKDVEVFASLSPDNYPLGIKDVVNFGDYPVVWTNKKYRMIYLNMGHGDAIFSDATQNLLIINAFRWVLSIDKKGDPFKEQRNLKK